MPTDRKPMHHIRANVVGYVGVFLALTGSAVALPGHDSVRSDDIVNGQVKRADVARNAVNGGKVANGTLGGPDIRESSLGPVPRARVSADAEQLGGSPPEDFQARVPFGCADGTAISAITAEGGTNCTDSAIFPISANVPSGDQVQVFSGPGGVNHPSTLVMHVNCHFAAQNSTRVSFGSSHHQSSSTTLNWLFSTGGATSTVNASGANFTGGVGFNFGGARLEGQFIYGDPQNGIGEVTTVNLHAFDGGSSCEIRGTAQFTQEVL